jgi:cobyrinic acid a,c-diamide synthase
MQQGLMIAALASGQGKTILTTALLNHYKTHPLQPFKSGPDYIDPQFHKHISGIPSVNLDHFMLNENQLQWTFRHYATGKIAICEGVMGFYDGIERGTSTYDVAKMLHLPVLLILDGSGSYSTLIAILEGVLHHAPHPTIKAIVFNRLSSNDHFQRIQTLFAKAFPNLPVIGWIPNHLEALKSRHLGLDLQNTTHATLQAITHEVLRNIDLKMLGSIMTFKPKIIRSYPFDTPKYVQEKTVCILRDEHFSFLYHDNLTLFQGLFKKVIIIEPSKNETIPKEAHTLYIPGGYVETQEAHKALFCAKEFRNSLKSFQGNIYAECAGLIYLGKGIATQHNYYPMSGILDIEFELLNRRKRLGYYLACDTIHNTLHKGHAFHYSQPIHPPQGAWNLFKSHAHTHEWGAWRQGKVLGTYLHTLFRAESALLEHYF